MLGAARACDLCASEEANTILDLPAPSLGTDGALHDLPLMKIQCTKCGLIRNGYQVGPQFLSSHYNEGYGPGISGLGSEPIFFTDGGPVSASVALRDWILEAVRTCGLTAPDRLLEVGCGVGALMSAFQFALPGLNATGIELDKAAVIAAQSRGLDVRVGTLETTESYFDAIVSVAVMEHLPSPAAFLRDVRGRLRKGGWAAIVVPVQDCGNRDIFFWDHLFHFHLAHVAALAHLSGLRCIHQSANHALHHGYGLSLLVNEDAGVAHPDFEPEYRQGHVAEAVAQWQAKLRLLDRWLDELNGKRVTVFGLGETFDFVRGYSKLQHYPVTAGLDENLKRAGARNWEFPIFLPTAEKLCEAEALLLTFRPGSRLKSSLSVLNKPVFILE